MHPEKPAQMNPTTSPTPTSKCESYAIGMVLQLADGTIQACNVQAQEILGMTSGQIQGWTSIDSPWQVIHENGSPFPGDTHPATIALQTGQPCSNVVMGFYQPSGKLIWLSLDAQPLFSDSDVPYGVVTSFREIVPQSDLFQPTESLLQHIMQTIPGTMYLYDIIEHRYVYKNRSVAERLGYTLSEIEVMEPFYRHLMHPDDLVGLPTYFEKINAASLGDIVSYKYRLRDPQAAWHWFESRTTIFNRTPDGQVRQIAGVTLDISNSLLAEETIANQLAEIEMLYEQAPIGLGLVDRDLRFVRVNQRLAEINGSTIAAQVGKTLREILPELHAKIEPLYQSVIQTGIPITNLEVRGATPSQSGVERDWLVNYHPLFGDNNQVTGITIVVQEITEQKRAEAALQEALKKLTFHIESEKAARQAAERASAIKDEFLAVLSHELRTPLNPILGWSQVLQKSKLDAQKTQTALATIERNAKLQIQLIDDLLDVSRILRGKLGLTVTAVDLTKTIASALETVRFAAEAKSIQIQTFATNIGLVMGDDGRLQQVIWNLLSNAVKFTPSGGAISIHLNRIGTTAQIQVIDTGIGIECEFLPYLFDSFRQEDSSITRKFGGLGLGLAIARQIVELHGGTLTAESPGIGQGATLLMQLPLAKQINITTTTENNEPQSVDLTGLRVLIVDDETDSRDLIAFILEAEGANVTAVADAAEVLYSLTQSTFDILISDLGMPDTDGYMLLRQIRTLNTEQGGQIPAIALSAYTGEYDQKQALSAGFNMHLSKPIEPQSLINAIATLIK